MLEIGTKVQTLVEDRAYIGVVDSIIEDLVKMTKIYVIEIPVLNDFVSRSIEDISIYVHPHISSSFSKKVIYE